MKLIATRDGFLPEAKFLLREGKVTSRRKPTGKGGIATYWTVQHNQGEANEHN